MNGSSAADMSTAAASGHAEGYQAGYADAVKAVEAGKDAAAPAAQFPTKPIGSDACPVTGLPFYDNMEHPERGMIAMYGGPFDVYSIPDLGDDDELRRERFDLDRDDWVEGGEPLGYFYREQQAEAASAPAAPGIDHLRSVINALSRSISDTYEKACQNGDERMQTVQNARQSLLNTIREALPPANDNPAEVVRKPDAAWEVDMVESAARIMFEQHADKLAAPWERQWESTKAHWRARAVEASIPAAPVDAVNYAKLYGMACEAADHAGFYVKIDEATGVLNLIPKASTSAAPGVDLREPMRNLYQAYVRLLESGMDRITSLGGDCDPVDVMEANDIDLRAAREALDASPKGGESMRDWSLRMAKLEEGQHVGAGAHGLQDSPKGGSEAAAAVALKAAEDAGHDCAIRYVLGYLNGTGDCGGTMYEEIINACGRERIIQSAIENGELEFTGLADFIKVDGTTAEKRKVRAALRMQATSAEVGA